MEGRRHSRHEIGSTAEFELNGIFYSTVVSNSSIGGLLMEFDPGRFPDVSAGDEIDITLSDIYSDLKFSYPCEVIRKFDQRLAVEFKRPVTDDLKKFLERWLSWQG